jgi:RNA polymerase-binding transcription factor DksA
MNDRVPYPLDYELTLARVIGVRLSALRVQAAELERAMSHLHDNDFGACRACGEAIPFMELAADPLAERCTACSKGER